MLDRLLRQNHKFSLLFNPEHAETQPNSNGCDDWIELTPSKDKLRMGPIYQPLQEEEKILVQYREKMCKE
jgi:hypothetical protein